MTTDNTPTNTKEYWSSDEETFNAESLGELLERGGDFEVGDTVHVADAIVPDPTRYVDVDGLLEQMGERASDDCGEAAEDFPDVTKEARQELEDLLKAWVAKHCAVTFWMVKNVRPYILTAEDLSI